MLRTEGLPASIPREGYVGDSHRWHHCLAIHLFCDSYNESVSTADETAAYPKDTNEEWARWERLAFQSNIATHCWARLSVSRM